MCALPRPLPSASRLWWSCQETRVHLQLFTENLLGTSGLDRLCLDIRDQGGVVADP